MDSKRRAVSVVGLGKLGCPIAGCFAAKGYNVIGVERDTRTVDFINQGLSPIFEPGLQAILEKGRGSLHATHDCSTAIAETDATFIVVPTPSEEDGTFSNQYVLAACEAIASGLANKQTFHLVILISTVMPGSTGGEIKRQLEQLSGKSCGTDFGLCYAPTFIALGSVVRDFLNPDYLLIGESETYSGDLLESLYRDICENEPKVARMNFMNAEMTKLANNTFITTKIAFGNMLAQICERLPEAHVDVVTSALGLDSRIGSKYMKGGLGYGGPCLDRDNVALTALAGNIGANAGIVVATDESNRLEVARLVALIESKRDAKMDNGGTVGVLGLSYKPGTDVVEASQGLNLAQALAAEGIPVIAYDPAALDRARHILGESVGLAESAEICIQKSDVVVVTTPWKEFEELTPCAFEASGPRVVIDCWRIFDASQFAAMTDYIALGVGPVSDGKTT